MNQQPVNTTGGYLRSLQVLSGALIAGMLLFAGITVVLRTTTLTSMPPTFPGKDDIVMAGVGGFTIVMGLIALVVYRRGVEKAKNLTGSLNEKLDLYRSTLVKYSALSEVGGLLSIVALFLTGDMRLLAVVTVSVLLLARGFATKKKVVSELQLNWQEEQDL